MGRAVEVLVWWVACTGVWVLTLSSFPVVELSVGAACGLLCAMSATVARHAIGGDWWPKVRWTRWLVVLPAAVVVDTLRVLVLPLRATGRDGSVGELSTLRLRSDQNRAMSDAHQAFATLVVATPPSSYVVDADPDQRTLLVHSVSSGQPSMDETVSE